MDIFEITKMFVSRISDAAGAAGETEVWLDLSRDSGYLLEDKHREFTGGYNEVNRMLYGMIEKSDKFCIIKGSKR